MKAAGTPWRVTTGSYLLQAGCKGGLFCTTGHKLVLGLLRDEHQNQIKNQQEKQLQS